MSTVPVVEASDWFRVTDLGAGVTLVEEPHVGELLSANIWHVRGRDRSSTPAWARTSAGTAPRCAGS